MINDILIDLMGDITFIDVKSDVSLLGGKKNEMKGRVSKISSGIKVKLMGNGDYEKDMGEIDENFEVKERRWGKRNNDGLIEHNGNFYVEVSVLESGDVEYYLDDKVISKNDITGLKENKSINDGLIIRTYKVDNIIKINVG